MRWRFREPARRIVPEVSSPIATRFSLCQTIFSAIKPTRVPTSSTIPLSIPSVSARAANSSSSLEGYSCSRDSMKA